MRFGHLPINLIVIYTVLNVALILLVLTFPFWSYLPAPILIAFLLTRLPRSGGECPAQAEAAARP